MVEGFKGVHQRQDKTNGKVGDNTEFRLKSEGSLATIKFLIGFLLVLLTYLYLLNYFGFNMKCLTTQRFGENKNNSYAKIHLKGHTGVDIVCGHGSVIKCPIGGFVYKILDDRTKAKRRIRVLGYFHYF